MIRSLDKLLRSGEQLVQKQMRRSMTTNPPKVHGRLVEGLDAKSAYVTLVAVTFIGGLFFKCDDSSRERAEALGKHIDRTNQRLDRTNQRLDETKEYLGKRLDRTNQRLDETKEYLGKRIDETNQRLDETKEYLGKRIDETKAEVSKMSDGITQILLLLAKTSPNVEKVTPSNTASAKEKKGE